MKPAVFDIVTNTPQSLVLRMRWFPPIVGFTGALVAAIPCSGMATLLFAENPFGQLLMMAVWCVSACMLAFNAEQLTVTKETLTVSTAPIPWLPWRRRIASAAVHSIECECQYLKGQRYSLRIFDSEMESVIALSGMETGQSCQEAAQLVAAWLEANTARGTTVTIKNPA